jgi:DNA-binding LacI/PurR family transcriptional regulator
VPVVTTGRYGSGKSVPWVDNDNGAGMRDLLGHVQEMGYGRPALINMSLELSYSRDIRDEFVRIAGADAPIVTTDEVTEEAGYLGALELLDAEDPPDVILASSDRQAIGALRAARELDIAVPEELGIAGAGDTIAEHTHPPLTSVRVSARELGETVVNWLLALIEGGEQPAQRTLATEVVARESTARRAKVIRARGTG